MKPLLTIAIPSIVGREKELNRLIHKLIDGNDYTNVNLLWEIDNKEMPIGQKRQILLEKASGEYIVQIDDDDLVPDYYIQEVLKTLESKPDCVGYLEEIRPGGKLAAHSNDYDRWEECRLNSVYNYHRTIFHKDPIRTDIARQIGFNPTLRFAEDHDFSIRLKQSGLLKNEVFLDFVMYIYNDPGSLTEQQKRERYGL